LSDLLRRRHTSFLIAVGSFGGSILARCRLRALRAQAEQESAIEAYANNTRKVQQARRAIITMADPRGVFQDGQTQVVIINSYSHTRVAWLEQLLSSLPWMRRWPSSRMHLHVSMPLRTKVDGRVAGVQWLDVLGMINRDYLLLRSKFPFAPRHIHMTGMLHSQLILPHRLPRPLLIGCIFPPTHRWRPNLHSVNTLLRLGDLVDLVLLRTCKHNPC